MIERISLGILNWEIVDGEEIGKRGNGSILSLNSLNRILTNLNKIKENDGKIKYKYWIEKLENPKIIDIESAMEYEKMIINSINDISEDKKMLVGVDELRSLEINKLHSNIELIGLLEIYKSMKSKIINNKIN